METSSHRSQKLEVNVFVGRATKIPWCPLGCRANGIMQVNVTFSPTTAGAAASTLTVGSTAPNETVSAVGRVTDSS